MPDIDNKVVSISFNNKQFMKDISDTMDVILKFNNATSGKNIDTSGLENLRKAFQTTTTNVSKDAESLTKYLTNLNDVSNTEFKTGGIDALRKALENTGMTAVDVEDTITSLQQLSRTGISYASDVGVATADSTASAIQQRSSETRDALSQDANTVADRFSMIEMIGVGAMLAIGNKAVEMGATLLRQFNGITDGWSEYNALTNSTQTILSNTERYGSTMEDVSTALSELNRYADQTTYAFSDMTRNIGYFTTAGVNLEDSVTAIQGLSNVGALFGADAQSVARAGYQMSQAMSAGVIRLMDWRSMVNAGMGGKTLQDELIRTAAVMSGTSIDAMNEYIESLGGFNQSLQTGWLTSDIFLETLRKFAGQSREYYESLTDDAGNRLYTDEEIDDLVQLGETAMESATKVRTFQQMMDAFKESIGSGWQQTFSLIIGNLEEAKEFWTPINNILTDVVNGFFSLQNGALESWRALGGRKELLDGIINIFSNLSNILSAIGGAFLDVFGGQHQIGNRLFQFTEALTDFTETLMWSDEELGYFRDFIGGLLEPISLIVEIIFQLVKAFFNAGDAMNEFDSRTDSIMDSTKEFRRSILIVLGYIGSLLKSFADFIRKNDKIQKAIKTFANIVKSVFSGVVKVIAAPFILLYQVWERYDIGTKLEELWQKVVTYFMPIIDAVKEVKQVFEDWLGPFKEQITNVINSLGGPLAILEEDFGFLIQLFKDLFDPTISISEAFSTFIDNIKHGGIETVLEAIRSAFSDLWDALKDTAIGQWFEDLKTKIQNAWNTFSQTPFGQWVTGVIDSIKEFVGVDTLSWDTFWATTETVVTTIADSISTGWGKIKTFFGELIDVIKEWFGISDGVEGSVEGVEDSMSGLSGVGGTGGMFSGYQGEMEGLNNAILSLATTVDTAEKMIPDPNSSKFLNFLSSIPEKISGVVDLVTHSRILKNIKEFFNLFTSQVSEFFNQDIHGQKNDILSFFADKVEQIEDLIGGLLGIDDFSFGEYGIFDTIAAVIVNFINVFGGIDETALSNLKSIFVLIQTVLITILQLKIVDVFINFAKGLKTSQAVLLQTAKATTQLNKAKKWREIAKALFSIALMIGLVIGAIVLISVMWENHRAGLIAGGVGIVLMFVAIGALVATLTKCASKISVGSLKGLHNTISSVSGLILSVTVSIAALMSIIFIATYLFESMTANQQGVFMQMLIVVGAVFLVIIAVVAGIFFWINKFNRDLSGFHLRLTSGKVISNVLMGVSAILLSIVVVIAGFVGTLIIFTAYINHLMQNGGKYWWAPLLIAGAILAVIIGAAAAIVVFLINTANRLSGVAAGTKAKQFRAVLTSLSVLLLTVVLSIGGLLAAAAGLVFIMGTVENSIPKLLVATAVVAVLTFVLFESISRMITSVRQLGTMNAGKLVAIFIMIELLLATIAAGAIGIIYFASKIANSLPKENLTIFIAAIAGIGVLFVGLIVALSALTKILSSAKMDFVNMNDIGKMALMVISLAGVMAVVTGALSLLVYTMASSGFLTNGGNLLVVMGSILALFAVMALAFGGIVLLVSKMPLLNTTKIMLIASSIDLLSVSLVVISVALSNLLSLNSTVGQLWTAFGIIAILFALVSAALGILTFIAKVNVGAMVVAALSLVAVTGSLYLIAYAISSLADMDTNKLLIAAGALGVLMVVMSVMMAILAGVASTGIGALALGVAAAAIIAIAVAYLMLGAAMEIFGEGVERVGNGLNSSVTAMERFVIAWNGLTNLNTEGVADKIGDLLSIISVTVQSFIPIASDIGRVAYELVYSVVRGAVVGIAAGIAEGFTFIANYINSNGEFIVNTFSQLGLLILSAIHSTNVAFVTMVQEDFGPGGIVRTLAETIADFVAWLSSRFFVWGMNIIESFLDGLIEAFGDQGQIVRIGLKLKLLYLGVKKNILNFLHIPDFKSLGQQLIYNILAGITEGIHDIINSDVGQAVQSVLEELGVDLSWLNNGLTNLSISFRSRAQQAAEGIDGEIERIRSELEDAEAHTEAYDDMSDSADKATNSTSGFFDSVISNLKTMLGLDNVDLSNMLGSFNLSGIFGDGFDTSSITGGLSGIGDSLGGLSTDGLFNFDTTQMADFSAGLGDISDVIGSDDFQSPVITPTMDTSQVALGIGDIESMWNNSEVDSFAIDAGNSILTSQGMNGDAATNGTTVVNYTQNNYSPEALPPIQIYRDTRNLLRGSINT